jgi:ABC-type dipeptide/oligopeptide/nickel transport system permease subunit
MLIEVVLMQKYQNFIGSPIYSTIVILGGLLFFSGLGSFFSRNFSKKILVICICVIPVLILFQAFFIGGIFDLLAKFSFHSKLIIASLLIFPLAFLMGIPFPHALEQIKKDVSNEYAALMYGVNGVFGTVAVSLSILLNVTYGMQFSLMLGFFTYLAAILLFIVIKE